MTMIMNNYLPEYQTAKQHQVMIDAPARIVYEAVKSLDMSKSGLIRFLFRLRGMPAASFRLEGMEKIGFIRLAENPGKELVIGVVGKFWTLHGALMPVHPAQFTSFNKPGFAKATWNFTLNPISETQTNLKTETRIHCTDKKSRFKFKIYWLAIGPFSAWTRKECLQIIKKDAEEMFKNRRAKK